MSQNPNVGIGMLHIHACITRGLEVSVKHGHVFARQGFDSPALMGGYLDYTRALVSTVHGHHLAEEDLFFPYLARLLPDAPYAALLDEHQQMVVILDQIRPHIEAVAPASDPTPELTQLVTLLQQLDSVWHPHIGREEASFTVQRLGELIPVPEHMRLLQELAAHAQKTSGPPYLTVPFLLFNLEPEARAAMAAGMPSVITQQLVPVEWKDKWAPMKPFLLP